jgi:hypothetical protein
MLDTHPNTSAPVDAAEHVVQRNSNVSGLVICISQLRLTLIYSSTQAVLSVKYWYPRIPPIHVYCDAALPPDRVGSLHVWFHRQLRLFMLLRSQSYKQGRACLI